MSKKSCGVGRFLGRTEISFEGAISVFSPKRSTFQVPTCSVCHGRRIVRFTDCRRRYAEGLHALRRGEPGSKIVQQVREKDILEDRYSIGRGIIFASYPSAISDVNLRVDSQVNTVPQVPANQELDSDQLRPDRICIYKAESEDGSLEQRKLIFIAEYKPPHKLTKEQLRTGLQPMDIYKDIVNHPTIPSQQNKRAYFRYCAKKLTAAAVTQAYHYMIEGGVSYGIMSNGEATVFLKVDWSNPGTLLYHLAEPKSEVPAHHPDGIISCSAVGQYLSFTLLALSQHHQHGERGQEERETVKKNLQRWKYNIDQMLLDMSPDNHKPRSPVDPDFSRPKTYSNVDRSPFLAYNLRRREGDEPARGPARRRSPPSPTTKQRRMPQIRPVLLYGGQGVEDVQPEDAEPGDARTLLSQEGPHQAEILLAASSTAPRNV
ncbi:hypothetical protein J3459_020915 [Metarhizium acridum]|nr:hypothetical protein J3459_020915 [Metarhizium acridum]